MFFLHNNYNQAQREYKHSLTFRVRRYVVIATKTYALIANPPDSAQPDRTPTIPQVTSGSMQ